MVIEERKVKYFNYASVDFLIDRNNIPVFIEANDNTLAPYYIEQKNYITQIAIEGANGLVNLNAGHRNAFLSCFDRYFENEQMDFGEKTKSIAIVCKRRDQPIEIEKEIQYLVQLFREHGYDAGMYTPEDFEIKQGIAYIKKDSTCPSIIFRRNFSFPPSSIKQPVINDLQVRNIVANKYWTHEIVEHLVNRGTVSIRQPKTYLVKDWLSLSNAIQKFHQNECDCIAKPNTSYGGDGFFCFKKSGNLTKTETREKLEAIAERLQAGEEYLVQEKIESSLFRSADGNEYYFDVRVMIYGGEFAGIEGRRSNTPFNRHRISEKSLVTNIKSGGLDLLVVGSFREGPCCESRKAFPVRELGNLNFEIDSNFLVLGKKLFLQIKQASEAIVNTIDERVSIREEILYG